MSDTLSLFFVVLFPLLGCVWALYFAIKKRKLKEEPQLLKLTRKVDLYYGLCGFKIDTINIPVKDYLSFRPHYDNLGYKVGNDTELMVTFTGYGGPAYEVTIKEGADYA